MIPASVDHVFASHMIGLCSSCPLSLSHTLSFPICKFGCPLLQVIWTWSPPWGTHKPWGVCFSLSQGKRLVIYLSLPQAQHRSSPGRTLTDSRDLILEEAASFLLSFPCLAQAGSVCGTVLSLPSYTAGESLCLLMYSFPQRSIIYIRENAQILR